MVDCCSTAECETSHPRKSRCPVNGNECSEVSARTIAHHIRESWMWVSKAGRYFYCEDPACDVVYFGDDGVLILKSQLRARVGAKEASDDDLVCYCFGVSKADALRDPAIMSFVVKQTRLGLCSCDTSNPSGRCCLKDFPVKGQAESS